MPRRDVRMYLWDIRTACDHIESFLDGATETEFLATRLLQAAVERELLIIGEALHQAIRQDESLREHISKWESIVRFRNMLAHAYDLIDHRRMWSVVALGLPLLRSEVDALLRAFGEEPA